MYIKSITLEGFKSYGTKTVISGFDPAFNAITGFNGSGKSNILDSICFVLGISNLSQVRATNLNELVYKNGQAGINKATVTIVFDNMDKAASPIGYENQKEISVTRIVVTGGKNKYLINGVSANNNRVHDLFQSVQLNVNNPHFLIMQGRITKVLNMKPMEILSMIEEAAGTRMYEEKKEIALKNLEKKESRLREINTMLEAHICPQLDKLKADQREYTEYTKVLREFERLSKLYVAWDFTQTEELIKKSGEEKEKLHQKSVELTSAIKEMKKQLVEADKRISELEKQMDVDGGNKLQSLEEELKKLQVTETKSDAQYKNLQEALNDERKKNNELTKTLKEDKWSLTQKQKEFQNSTVKLGNLKAVSDKDQEDIIAAENHFHAVNAGLSGAKGEEASLAAQMIAAGKDKKDAETEAKSIQMSLKHMEGELEKRKVELKKVDKSYTQDQAAYQALEKEIKKLKAEISALNYEEGKFENLLISERKSKQEIESCKDRIDSIFASYPQLSFDYAEPAKNFNHEKVRGPVCLQMELKDPKDAVALEVTAAGRLYNVVIDDEITGKLLLDKGQLKRRCTFIPLNKIVSNPIDDKTLHEAQALVGKNNVVTALSCINFDNHLLPAMRYVFGGTFVCPDMESAKKVAFANNIRRRTVTLEGEVFDPSGTLSGGSMGNRGKLLVELTPVPALKRKLTEKTLQLNKLQKEIQSLKKVKERYDTLNEQLELKENEASLLKSKIEQSNHHKQLEEYEKLKQSIENQKGLLSVSKEKQKTAEKLLKELESKSSKSTRETKIKEAEKIVSDSKKKAAASLEKYNAYQAEVDGLKMEIEGIIEGFPACEEAIADSSKTMEELEKKIIEAQENRKAIKESVSSLAEKIKAQKAVMKAHNSEINKISKEKETVMKNIGSSELQIQQLEHDVKNSATDVADAKKKLKHFLDNYKWIEGQKKYFGVPNSEFDFKALDPRTASTHLKKLEEQKDNLHKRVNMRAVAMLSAVEEQYKNLIKKKDLVMKDKEVINSVIKELDERTKVTIKKACEQVNKDFGSIFRTLLPGTKAKLVPPQGKTVLEGLEFKVAFGDVWKESLSELSGGQRSLVALSLILALLLFNPAPIYILDEVDAALDLSHTQNIGRMLKMHFQKSQFIIVSLKDGMFNNANVLFRTNFSDGMSSVTRTTQKQ